MQNSNGPYGNGFGYPPHRNNIPSTPTPSRHSVVNSNVGMTNQTGRYIPPPRRNAPPPISRPESAMSNATFASQPPMTPFLPANPLAGSSAFPPTHQLPPRGDYRYGPQQLNNDFARLDTGMASARGTPGGPRVGGNGNGKLYTLGTGLDFRNGGVRPGFADNTPTHAPGVIGSGRKNHNNVEQTTAFTSTPGSHAGSHPSSRSSSYAGSQPGSHPGSHPGSNNGAGVANYKGVHVARMIKNGAFEDPRHVDFGNPGPSKHPAAAALAKSLDAPLRRGHVAAGAGTASNHDSPYEAVRNANIRGNAAAYLGSMPAPAPRWLKEFEECEIQPSVEQVFQDLPVIEACRVAKPTTAGVVLIRNLPYLTSKSEIMAFLGRNAQVVHQPIGTPFNAIHVIMDRLSGKTLDCFIEVESVREATTIHNHFKKRLDSGRHVKIGDRPVIVQQSSQQEMMNELFPRGKNVSWFGNIPKIDDSNLEEFYPGVFSTGFEGFLNEEELAHMIKHVEMPSRSPFAQRCIIRPYECVIYTLHKYPWYAVDEIFCHERDYLFRVFLKAMDALMQLLRRVGGSGTSKPNATMPTSGTLYELVTAGLTCPGFSELQKARVHRHLHNAGFGQYSVPKGLNVIFGGSHEYSEFWPFSVLVKKPNAREELLEFVASTCRDATKGDELSLADLQSMQTSGINKHPFGNLDVTYGKKMTIAEVARVELRAVEKSLLHTLPRTHVGSGRRAPGLAGPGMHPRNVMPSPFS